MPHDGVKHGSTHHHHHHNHYTGDHLLSHMEEPDRAAELQVLTAQFIDGFVQAADKMAYLRLANIPFEIAGENEGDESLKLVDVQLSTEWQVGSASPSFGRGALSYLPFTGEMVRERTNMNLVYVSLVHKEVVDLRAFLSAKLEGL
ncbi:MAG: hypothetical protein ACPGOV_10180 [Magnetovibrionaceae bacterium]